jgi:hypothetical protein
MKRLQYVFDQHVLTAGQVAATHVSKWWTPGERYEQVVTAGGPVCDEPGEEWELYQCQVSVGSALGYGRQGHQVKLLTNGPPGHGGIHLVMHQQQNGMAVFTGKVPTRYGFGWAFWAGGRLVAGDCVQFNAAYRVVHHG